MNNLDWPPEFDRTPPRERARYPHGFQVSMQRAFRNIQTQLSRMGVDDYRITSGTDHQSADPDMPYQNAPNQPEDPGVVVRWTIDGEQYAAPCDRWNNIRDNAQAIAKYLDAKRALDRYGVSTVESEFRAQALPSGEEDAVVVAGTGGDPPHEVLGVAPDAPDEVIRAAARRLAANEHPDKGGDEREFKKIQKAKEALLS